MWLVVYGSRQLYSHWGVEHILRIDLLLQFLQFFVIRSAVIISIDDWIMSHINISKRSPEEFFFAIFWGIIAFFNSLSHFLLKPLCLILSLWISVFIVKDIKHKEMYEIPIGNRSYRKLINFDVSIIPMNSATK